MLTWHRLAGRHGRPCGLGLLGLWRLIEELQTLHLAPKFLGDLAGDGGVLQRPRGDQNHQLGTAAGVRGGLEQVTEQGDVGETRDAGLGLVLVLPDQAAEDDGLSALDGDAAVDLALLDRGRQAPGRTWCHVAYFLLDLHDHESAGAYTGPDREQHAGVAELDIVDSA